MNKSRSNYFLFPLKNPFPKISWSTLNKNSRKCFVSPMKLNLKVTRQFPPPTRNPWNGSSGHCRHTKTRMNHHNQSAPRVDLLFSSSASTGGSTDSIEQWCFSLQPDSPRFYSRSNKDEKQTKQKMKIEDTPLPRKRKNKFPVAVPWISPLSNPWHFPRWPPPNRTLSELILF